MSEKLQNSHELHTTDPEVEKASAAERERLQDKLEQRAEKAAEVNKEQLENEARASAERHAEKQEKAEVSPAEKRKPKPLPRSKSNLEANFKLTLNDAQKHMSAPSKVFSKVIHNKAVERTSDVVGATVARPNAVLAGALSAFLFTLALYLLARRNGYPLSGTETIAAFIVGWVIGNLFDYLRLMITGKKPGQL